jgi:hypothetical protein
MRVIDLGWMRGTQSKTLGENTLGESECEVVENLRARRDEVNHNHRSVRDTCRQIIEFGWKYYGGSKRGELKLLKLEGSKLIVVVDLKGGHMLIDRRDMVMCAKGGKESLTDS